MAKKQYKSIYVKSEELTTQDWYRAMGFFKVLKADSKAVIKLLKNFFNRSR